jgi:hypothetical protein
MAKSTGKPAAPVSTSKPLGNSVEEFRRTYDKSYIVPLKVREALAKLGNGWMRELEFAKLAGVSANDLAAHRAEFEDHIVTLNGNDRGRRAWAGTKALASKLRTMLA